MTPDVVVDVGNSRIKWGRVSGRRVAEVAAFDHDDAMGWKRHSHLWALGPATRWAVAGVVPRVVLRFREWLASRDMTSVAVTNDLIAAGDNPYEFQTAVEEPDRIGVDRLLTALAAWRRTPSGASAVVLNVGTAMTIDFVESEGLHRGGAILPGPRLMAQSLHEYTAKLPLIDIDPRLPTDVFGANTEDAIDLGIANAVLGVADQMVWDWASSHEVPPWVYATGGDVGYFRGFVFTADLGGFVVDPTLTLDGIRLAAEALP